MTVKANKEKLKLVREYLIKGLKYLIEHHPTIPASIMPYLHIVFDDSVPTMGVSEDFVLVINPDFVINYIIKNAETENERIYYMATVLMHEFLHLFLNHPARCKQKGYNPTLWNVATDLHINEVITRTFNIPYAEEFFRKTQGLYEPNKMFITKSADEIYREFIEKTPGQHLQKPQGGSQQQGASGNDENEQKGRASKSGKRKEKKGAKNGKGYKEVTDVDMKKTKIRDISDISKGDWDSIIPKNLGNPRIDKNWAKTKNEDYEKKVEKVYEQIKEEILKRAMIEKGMRMAGRGHTELDWILQELTKRTLSLSKLFKDAWSYAGKYYIFKADPMKLYKPIYVRLGIALPTITPKTKQKIIMVVDTSGSISENELKEFLSAGYNTVTKEKQDVDLILHTDKVYKVIKGARNVAQFIKKLKEGKETIGRGGTDGDPVIKYILENYQPNKVKGIVWLTDGWFSISRSLLDSYFRKGFGKKTVMFITDKSSIDSWKDIFKCIYLDLSKT